jgi:glutathione peroxidase
MDAVESMAEEKKVLARMRQALQQDLAPLGEALWQAYKGRGLVVLGVPCNDFGAQEPGTEGEIKAFCETRFGVDFPMAGKAHVIGADAHPFYQWAASVLGEGSTPRWNFHKYLIGRDGSLAGVFGSRTDPEAAEVKAAIEAALT